MTFFQLIKKMTGLIGKHWQPLFLLLLSLMVWDWLLFKLIACLPSLRDHLSVSSFIVLITMLTVGMMLMTCFSINLLIVYLDALAQKQALNHRLFFLQAVKKAPIQLLYNVLLCLWLVIMILPVLGIEILGYWLLFKDAFSGSSTASLGLCSYGAVCAALLIYIYLAVTYRFYFVEWLLVVDKQKLFDSFSQSKVLVKKILAFKLFLKMSIFMAIIYFVTGWFAQSSASLYPWLTSCISTLPVVMGLILKAILYRQQKAQ